MIFEGFDKKFGYAKYRTHMEGMEVRWPPIYNHG